MKNKIINNYLDAIALVNCTKESVIKKLNDCDKLASLLFEQVKIVSKLGKKIKEPTDDISVLIDTIDGIILNTFEGVDFVKGYTLIEDVVKEYDLLTNSYTYQKEDSSNDKKVYYETFIQELYYYFTSDREKGVNNWDYLVNKFYMDLYNELSDEFNKTKLLVSKFLKDNINKVTENYVMPSSDIKMVNEFPSSCHIMIGEYVNNSTTHSELLDERDKIIKKFSDLSIELSSKNRLSDYFVTRLEDFFSSDSILIHQPTYSQTEVDDNALIELLETIILQYNQAFPRISKRCALLQERRLSNLDGFLANLYSVSHDLCMRSDDEDYSNAFNPSILLKRILSECQTANEILGTTYSNLYTYNLNSYKDGVWKQMTLLIIKDYPLGFDEQACKLLKTIIQDAKKFGIFIICTVCDDLLNAPNKFGNKVDYSEFLNVFKEDCIFDIDGYTLKERFSGEVINFKNILVDFNTFNKIAYFDNLESYLKNSFDPAIPLSSLFTGRNDINNMESDERREKFFKLLSFPVARFGTKPYNINLYQSGGGSPHIVISGTTGSGKSVLLHDIILSSMYLYTPSELEIYLFDFKPTPGGFMQYATNYFPHVKKIATKCLTRDIYELLEMVRNIYTSRMNSIKEVILNDTVYSFSNINSYNKFARTNGLKQIPRVMVVIDEYQSIDDEGCISILLDIARKAREYGVVLVMASQSANVANFSNIIKQFGHRFEFKSEGLGGLISKITSRAQELYGPAGLCFYSPDGSNGIPVLIRCAYVDIEKEITKISSHFTSLYQDKYPSPTYLVGSLNGLNRDYDYNKTFTLLKDTSNPTIFKEEAIDEEKWILSSSIKYQSTNNLKGRGFYLRLGLNSISLRRFEVVLDRLNPTLLLLGDKSRMESLEYSIVRSASLASNNEAVIYYLDGEISDYSVLDLLASECKNFKYYSYGADSLREGVNIIYEEYIKRSTSSKLSSPCIIMISNFEEVYKVVSNTNSISSKPTKNYDKLLAMAKKFGTAEEVNKILKEMEESKNNTSNDDLSLTNKFASIFKGNNLDMFTCITTSSLNSDDAIRSFIKLNTLQEAIVLFKEATLDEERIDDELTSNFNLLDNYLHQLFRDTRIKLTKDEINSKYGYKITKDKLTEFIPYIIKGKKV